MGVVGGRWLLACVRGDDCTRSGLCIGRLALLEVGMDCASGLVGFLLLRLRLRWRTGLLG